MDLRLQGDRVSLADFNGADDLGWRERLQIIKRLNPKPILRLTIADRASCDQASAVMRDVTEIYGCTKLHCAVVTQADDK